MELPMRFLPPALLPALTLLALVPACNNQANEELTRRVAEANGTISELKRDNTRLETEVKGLKRQLAQALANPGKIVLDDPEIIELIADLRASAAPAGGIGEELSIGKGDLNPKEASAVVMRGARALQQCYERALKKNQALQYQAGVQMVLGITVKATGRVDDVNVAPSIDGGLTACIDTAVKGWKFPKFAGSAVSIEQRVRLTPKT